MSELFTIGHSNHDMAHFISLLQCHHIDYLLDVRSTPYSKYAEQFILLNDFTCRETRLHNAD